MAGYSNEDDSATKLLDQYAIEDIQEDYDDHTTPTTPPSLPHFLTDSVNDIDGGVVVSLALSLSYSLTHTLSLPLLHSLALPYALYSSFSTCVCEFK